MVAFPYRAASLGLLFMANAVAAADQATTPPAPSDQGYIVTVGLTGEIGPKYDGARVFGPSGLPSFSVRRVGEPREFSAPDDGLDYTLVDAGPFKFGPVASLRAGRYRSSDAQLTGLDNVPLTLEAGAFAEYWPIADRLRTRVELRQGLRAHAGLVADFSVDLVRQVDRFTLSGGPRLTLADGDFMNLRFGVTPAAAMRNGLVFPFDPKPGIESVGYNVALGYQWSDAWTTTIFQTYGRLVGDAARSPIVSRLGARDQFTFGATLDYSFKINL